MNVRDIKVQYIRLHPDIFESSLDIVQIHNKENPFRKTITSINIKNIKGQKRPPHPAIVPLTNMRNLEKDLQDAGRKRMLSNLTSIQMYTGIKPQIDIDLYLAGSKIKENRNSYRLLILDSLSEV